MASTIQVDTIKDIGGNTMLSSNGSGTFTSNLPASVSNTPAFNVKLSSNQDVSSDTTTVVAFNSEQVDTDNAFNTTTYRFIPQTAGKYFIAFTIYALTVSAGNANLQSITANIRKNGSNETQVVQDYNSSFIRQGCATTTSVIDMNGSTDYIDFTASSKAGSGDGRFENHTRANGFLLIG
tara:strand:- start:288 stop:827 length:540 start_codon:yes stop_codon:yes gene_type:complete